MKKRPSLKNIIIILLIILAVWGLYCFIYFAYISVANLLKKFADGKSSSLGLRSSPTDIGTGYKNQVVPDNRDGTIRIANILRQVHARKIKTSFNSSLLE